MGKSCTLYELFLNSTNRSFKVIFHDIHIKQIMSYEEFCSNVNHVAEILKSLVSFHSIVGCLIRPSLILPVVTLGICKISSPFTFLDAQTPLKSLKNLQNYVPVQNLLTEEVLLTVLLKELCSCWKKKGEIVLDNSKPLIVLQCGHCSNEHCPQSFKSYPNFTNASELGYIIQTSGTTGEPKIVQVPYQCIVPNIIDLKSKFSVTSEDVLLMCAPLTFDPSVIELFLGLSSGCTLVIIPDYVKSIPRIFLDVFRDMKITIIQATPSLILGLGETNIKEILLSDDSSLRILAFGGEDCPTLSKLKKLCSPRNKTRIFNLYGLTEVSCWASSHEIIFNTCSLSAGLPLGKPLLETDMELGKDGELYVGGKKRWCIINNEPWPTHGNSIMRATGDLAIKTSDGDIYYSGRKDSTFKYKGRKISLFRINSIFESISDVVNHCIHFDRKSEKLFLFIVLQAEAKFENEMKHNIIKAVQKSVSHLPVIEVIPVSCIPLTKHGKANHRKLLEFAKAECQHEKPLTTTFWNGCVEFITNLWKEYTNQETISDEHNFIMAGGNSISALQFLADIEREYHILIPELIEILLNQSFKHVLQFVRTHLFGTEPISCDITPRPFVAEEESSLPLAKRRCVDAFSCYEVSSRRGYSLRCSSPGEHAHAAITKLKKRSTLSLVMKCKFDLKKCIDSTPCVSHNFKSNETLAFIGSHSGIFCCINIQNDLLVWSFNLPDRIESSACLSYCGTYVFVGCYDHHVYCFDVSTGTIHWKFCTAAEVKSSPVVSSQNVVYVGSHDKHLYAFVAETGELLWKKQISKGSIFSSPALSDTLSAVIVASLDGTVAALKMDSGATIWSYNHGKPLFSSPLCTSFSVVIGSTNNAVLQLDLTSGMLTTHHITAGSVFSSPTLGSSSQNEQFIFGCHDCQVYCINSNSEFVWKFQCDSSVYATPFAFQWTQGNYVAVASTSGTIYILDQSNGGIKSTCTCPGQIFSSPVILNNYLIVGCRDNFAYCFTLSAVMK